MKTDGIIDLMTMTGALFWAVVVFCVAAWIVLGVIPAMFRWLCYVGYSAFADKAEKAAAREYGRQRAECRKAASYEG